MLPDPPSCLPCRPHAGTWLACVLALLASAPVLAATPADPDTVTVYRCVSAKGQVSLRDTPCAAGERQDTRTLARPLDAPPPPAPAAAPVVAPAAPARRVEIVTRPALAPLYECVRPDGSRYTSEHDDGNLRWVPLWTLGVPVLRTRNPLGDHVGAPAPRGDRTGPGPPSRLPVQAIGYPLGTWVRDQCHALPQAEVCARLRDRLDAIGDARFNAQANERLRLAEEERGVRARLAQDCP
jgi:hypothetical protein